MGHRKNVPVFGLWLVAISFPQFVFSVLFLSTCFSHSRWNKMHFISPHWFVVFNDNAQQRKWRQQHWARWFSAQASTAAPSLPLFIHLSFPPSPLLSFIHSYTHIYSHAHTHSLSSLTVLWRRQVLTRFKVMRAKIRALFHYWRWGVAHQTSRSASLKYFYTHADKSSGCFL